MFKVLEDKQIPPEEHKYKPMKEMHLKNNNQYMRSICYVGNKKLEGIPSIEIHKDVGTLSAFSKDEVWKDGVR